MIIDMPRGQQSYTYDCGTKALHLVMAYYGVEVPYYKLLRHADKHKRYGISESKLVNIARGYHLKVVTSQNSAMDFKYLIAHITTHNPVIVLMQAWADKKLNDLEWQTTDDFGHYSIVCGCDRYKIYLNDTLSFRIIEMSNLEFLDRWHCGSGRRFGMYFVANADDFSKFVSMT